MVFLDQILDVKHLALKLLSESYIFVRLSSIHQSYWTITENQIIPDFSLLFSHHLVLQHQLPRQEKNSCEYYPISSMAYSNYNKIFSINPSSTNFLTTILHNSCSFVKEQSIINQLISFHIIDEYLRLMSLNYQMNSLKVQPIQVGFIVLFTMVFDCFLDRIC